MLLQRVIAMECIENTLIKKYFQNLTTKIDMPTILFPQYSEKSINFNHIMK